ELARDAVDIGAQVVETDGLVARRASDAGGCAVFTEAFAQRKAPFARGDAGLGTDDGGRHDVAVLARRGAQFLERRRHRLLVAAGAPRLETLDLRGLGLGRHGEDGVGRAGERRGLALHETIDPDHGLLAALDRLDAARVRFHELLLHVALLDRGDRAAQRLRVGEPLLGLALELPDLGGDRRRAIEDVAVFEEVGLVGENLLHAQRPLLVPRPRQAERLVPGRQLHRARARVLR